ncbi:uncharacterized protein [Haliotis cracherodii]|uniref:uncharacterized protein isoform X2 n=1 Tax=Haliotis cracherodii TaxID=6455 RepID=UPI0039EC635D
MKWITRALSVRHWNTDDLKVQDTKMGMSKYLRKTGVRLFIKPFLLLMTLFAFYLSLRSQITAQISSEVERLRAQVNSIQTKNGELFHIPDTVESEEVNSLPNIQHGTGTQRNHLEKTLVNIYKSKLKDIKVPPSTAKLSCDDEESIDRPCVDTRCKADFLQPQEENLVDVLRRQYPIPEKYMRVIEKMVDPRRDKTRISFVTAASANHFYECQVLMKNLIENVFPSLSQFRFYVYDLGLTPEQVLTLKKHCPVCILRKFPFSELPPVFSNLKSYTWKPTIIQAHLPVSKYVFWMDASVRFLVRNLTGILETVRNRGMMISPSHVSTPLHTDPKMYDYFGVEPCQMSRFREMEGTFLIFHNDVFTQNAIVLPWLACAFAPNCMYPFKEIPASSSHYSCKTTQRKYGTCHRFDQAALSTILIKIFADDVGYVLLKKNTINVNKRGEKIKFFPEDK